MKVRAAQKDKRSVDKQAPTCDKETGCGRRMGTEEIKRHWVVGREEVSWDVTKRRHGEALAVPLSVME